MTIQLRRYEFEPEVPDAFVTWWRDVILPVRDAFGFTVVFAFVTEDRTEFVWAVEHPDLDAAEARYQASEERAAAVSSMPPGMRAQHITKVDPVW